MFHFSSFIIPGLIMLPSVSFAFLSPRNMPAPEEKRVHSFWPVMEAIGRAGTVALPLFFPFYLEQWYELAALAGMAVCLLLYYAVWIAYYMGGRNFARLFAPLWGIPVPLAVFPSLYFLFASVVLHAIPLLAAGLIFGASHIVVSLHTYRRIVR